MAQLSISNIRLTAISACVPKQKEMTMGYAHMPENEKELFIKTTGISERRVASAGTTCSDLCFTAASDLLKKFNVKDEIDALIFVSQSPDYFLPATSILLQHRLELKNTCIAFDVNLGCSGYVYGLSILGSMMQGGQIKKALLLAGDKSTLSTCYTDKSAYPLFGDAGTATLLEYSQGAPAWDFNLQSDGSGKESIIIEHGHSRHPYDPSSEEIMTIDTGIRRAKKHLALNGMEIFNFALKEVAPNIQSLLEQSGRGIDEIDHFIFHQANKLINESVRKKLKAEAAKTPYSIDKFGNTSSASIPLTICNNLKNEIGSQNLTLLLSGFGVGYSWGSVVLNTRNVYTNLSEHD